MEPVVGIDLGTTNSVVAYTNENGIVTVIKGSSGSPILPSVVYFPEGGEDPVVGEQAKRQAVMKPARVARFFKRGMGEQTFLDSKGDFVVDGTVWRPEALSSLVLKKLKQMAEEHFGQPVTKAIITVPAYFGDAERTATRKAGDMAGLEVLRLINEPTAAAIAHGLDKQTGVGHIVVFDLGGGTFDVTVLKVDSDKQMTVLGSSGDHRLGGVDFDRLIIDAMADRALAELGTDIRQDPGDLSDALESAEQLKIDLSTLESASARLSVGGQRFVFDMTRQQFNGLLEERGYLGDDGEVKEHVENAIEDAGLSKGDISAIVMVGGSSRIPAFIDLVKDICGKDPLFANMDEDVARGASIVAAMVDSEVEGAGGVKVSPITEILGMPMPIDAATHSLGTSVLIPPDYRELANQVMIEMGTPLPAHSEETFYTVQDHQTAIEVTLNEGEGTNLQFVKTLAEALGKFPKGPVPKDYPVRAVMKYEADQKITLEAHDGNTGEFLCRLEYEYKQLMSDSDVERKKQEVINMRIGG